MFNDSTPEHPSVGRSPRERWVSWQALHSTSITLNSKLSDFGTEKFYGSFVSFTHYICYNVYKLSSENTQRCYCNQSTIKPSLPINISECTGVPPMGYRCAEISMPHNSGGDQSLPPQSVMPLSIYPDML